MEMKKCKERFLPLLDALKRLKVKGKFPNE